MGSQMNFKAFGDAQSLEGSGLKPPGNFPLTRQSSIYSMTFDELQNMGGLGKDFGSMNMDELLKNLWTAEETQAMMTASAAAGEGSGPGGNLQRQGSLTLPRTLSQKTVDEVWRDLLKENGGVKDGSSSGGGLNLPQRQHTLGEMTLEDFLVRAGVVREDAQQMAMSSSAGYFGDLSRQNNNTGLALGFQQTNQNNGLMGNNNSVLNHQPPRLALNMGDVQSMQQQLRQRPPLQQQQQQQQQPQPLFPKQANVAFAPSMQVVNPTQRASPVARGPVGGIRDQSMNNKLVPPSGLQTGGGMGIVGLGSPVSKISPDIIPKSNFDTSSLSPSPYAFGRGRKGSAALEKVVERRQRRMIKNRESAARSRARKQAYTLELEAEVAKLKELNDELQKKQMEMMETQKNQMLQDLRPPWASKRQCLRRTLTGPW